MEANIFVSIVGRLRLRVRNVECILLTEVMLCVRTEVVAWGLSALHAGTQFSLLFSDRKVGPGWRRLRRLHWVPNVVPRRRGPAQLQVSQPRPVNPRLEVGKIALRSCLLSDRAGLRNSDLLC